MVSISQSAPAKDFPDFINANPKATDTSLGGTAAEARECPLRTSRVGKLPVRLPEEFRAPKAYESLGGTNPRWAGLCLWGLGILADAGRGAAIAPALRPTCLVPVPVRDLPVLRAVMIGDSER